MRHISHVVKVSSSINHENEKVIEQIKHVMEQVKDVTVQKHVQQELQTITIAKKKVEELVRQVHFHEHKLTRVEEKKSHLLQEIHQTSDIHTKIELEKQLTTVETEILHEYNIVKTYTTEIQIEEQVIIEHTNIIRKDTGIQIDAPKPIQVMPEDGSVEPQLPVELEELDSENQKVIEQIKHVLSEVTNATVHEFVQQELTIIIKTEEKVKKLTEKIFILEKQLYDYDLEISSTEVIQNTTFDRSGQAQS